MGRLILLSNLRQPFEEKLQQGLHEIRPDYTLSHFLGEGSFGIVYQIQNDAGDTLCLKVLATPGAEKTKVLRAVETLGVSGILEREKYPKNFHHANIVDVVESISIQIDDMEIPCVVQKKIEGPTLEEFLAECPIEERLRYFPIIAQGIAAGVGHVHASGIAHRDIKPGNIKIDANNNPRIFDFSIAEKVNDDGRIVNHMPAEPSHKYSAPEVQLKKQSIDARRADVWSMGLIFYEYITGKNPRVGESLHFQKHLLPRRYRAIIDRCLEHEPEKRYKDGNEVYRALKKAERYYATRAAAVLGIPALILALTALPMGIQTLKLRMVSDYTNTCVTAIDQRALKEAVYSCEKALDWDEENCIAKVNLGHAFFLDGKEEQAKVTYGMAYHFCEGEHPNDANFSVSDEIGTLALQLKQQGRKEKAKTLLNMLGTVDPGYPERKDEYSQTLLDILMEEEEYAQATNVLETMMDKKEISAAYFYQLASWHKQQEHFAYALSLAKNAVTKERKNVKENPAHTLSGVTTDRDLDKLADYLFLLGDIHFAQHEYEPALVAYQEANSIRPDKPDVFVNIAEIWTYDGNYKGAKETLKRAEIMYRQMIAIEKGERITLEEKGVPARETDQTLFAYYNSLSAVYEKMKMLATLENVSTREFERKLLQTRQEMREYE